MMVMAKARFTVILLLGLVLFNSSVCSQDLNKAKTKGKPIVSVVEYADFECPFCAKIAPVIKQLKQAYPDQLVVQFKHYPLDFHANAKRAHLAALAAGEQGQFWAMHDLLYARPSALSRVDLLKDAKELGLNIDKFKVAIDSAKFLERINNDIKEGKSLGVTGTPTLFINGQRVSGARSFKEYKTYIDQALGIRPVNLKIVVEQQQKQIPAIDIANSPIRGDVDALITVVSFYDMQCPFCKENGLVIKKLLKKYSGQVNQVFKHYPLPFHKDAMLAHKAILAAKEQHRFWEMQDLLLQRQSRISNKNLLTYAAELGLEQKRFLVDLRQEKYKKTIDQDIRQGEALGVSATPTNIINGTLITGAKSLEYYSNIIDLKLSQLRSDIKTVAHAVLQNADKAASMGNENAAVDIVVFSDFSSTLSAQNAWLLQTLMQQNPQQMHVQFRYFPLNIKIQSLKGNAAWAAGLQGKFKEMHDLMYAIPRDLTRAQVILLGGKIGLEVEKFITALNSSGYEKQLKQDVKVAKRLGVKGVPTMFVNGIRQDGIPSVEKLSELIDSAQSTGEEKFKRDQT